MEGVEALGREPFRDARDDRLVLEGRSRVAAPGALRRILSRLSVDIEESFGLRVPGLELGIAVRPGRGCTALELAHCEIGGSEAEGAAAEEFRGSADVVVGTGHEGPSFAVEPGLPRVVAASNGNLADVRSAVALTHQSANLGVYGLAIAALDVPEERRPQVVAHAVATGTDKPSRVDVTTPLELQVALDVAEILYGGEWHDRPRLWTVINTTSPLQLSVEAGRALLCLARLGQPVCLTACAMAGTTAPLTLAGLLAVQHAELLTGLVLTQLARPGCPFLYGGTSSVTSMHSGALLMGAPEYWPLVQATVALGHHLPVLAVGGDLDAPGLGIGLLPDHRQLAAQRPVQVRHAGLLRRQTEDGVLNHVDLRTRPAEALAQFGDGPDLEALVIHDDEKWRGIEPGQVFLAEILFFGAHDG